MGTHFSGNPVVC